MSLLSTALTGTALEILHNEIGDSVTYKTAAEYAASAAGTEITVRLRVMGTDRNFNDAAGVVDLEELEARIAMNADDGIASPAVGDVIVYSSKAFTVMDITDASHGMATLRLQHRETVERSRDRRRST